MKPAYSNEEPVTTDEVRLTYFCRQSQVADGGIGYLSVGSEVVACLNGFKK